MLYKDKKLISLIEVYAYLILGISIYLFLRKPFPLLSNIFEIPASKSAVIDISFLPEFITVFVKYHLTDIFWGLSFFTALQAITNKPLIASAVVLIVTSLYELAQTLSIVSGTGDWWDIIFTACAVAINIFLKGWLKKMSKGINALLVVLTVLCFTVFAIASGEDNSAKNNGTDNPSSAKKSQTYGLNQTAAFKEITITANKIETSTGDEYFAPAEGRVFVGVEFTIENISDEDRTISSVLLFDAYADDTKSDYSINANIAFGDGTLDGSLSPGKKMTGYYAVEVPVTTQKITLEVKDSWLDSSKAVFEFNIPK